MKTLSKHADAISLVFIISALIFFMIQQSEPEDFFFFMVAVFLFKTVSPIDENIVDIAFSVGLLALFVLYGNFWFLGFSVFYFLCAYPYISDNVIRLHASLNKKENA